MNDRRKDFIKTHIRPDDRNKIRRFSKNLDELTEQELEQLSNIMRGSDGKSVDAIFENLCDWGWFNEVAVSMVRKLYKRRLL